ncbi:MAG: hypothetical protein AB8G22_01725 [Saprospiraceae bacterium]
MTRTLAIILNHNLPVLTDNLYESLFPFTKKDFDLMVMDNGSISKLRSKYTSYSNEKNLFWGGALNVAFKMVLENEEYDSLLFLNNDIEWNGEIAVKQLRRELFENDLAIVSPCIAGNPAPWKQMQNWGTNATRLVKWIDNQAPLFHRKLIEKIVQFDESLYLGWGQELVCYEVCKEQHWQIGVCDNLCILHYGQQTLKQKRLNGGLFRRILSKLGRQSVNDGRSFSKQADKAWRALYSDTPDRFLHLIAYGHEYNESMIEFIHKKTDRNPLDKQF